MRASSEKGTLYGWAFRAGQEILKQFEKIYGEDVNKIEKRMMTSLLNLRSELLPAKFRRELANLIIEVKPEIGFPLEIKEERAWRIDEFYRYSTAILAGFYDALQDWKKEKERKKEKAEERGGGKGA